MSGVVWRREQQAGTSSDDPLLATLRESTGVDLSEYRPATLERRVLARVRRLGLNSVEDYLPRLQADPAEPARLLAQITIKVSRFFRNRPIFERLALEVLPELLGSGRPPRCWCAGCGFGEEAYSLALLLLEAGATEPPLLASDVDPAALAGTALGCYPAAALAELSPDRLHRFFVPRPKLDDGTWQVSALLRRRVQPLQHDLLGGRLPPGAPFDLISCRNVQIYYSAAAQRRLQRLLLDALAPGGYLLLGEAESIDRLLQGELLAVDRRWRLFRRPDRRR